MRKIVFIAVITVTLMASCTKDIEDLEMISTQQKREYPTTKKDTITPSTSNINYSAGPDDDPITVKPPKK
jgi:hypothetical protein